jgi:uncharacterized protein
MKLKRLESFIASLSIAKAVLFLLAIILLLSAVHKYATEIFNIGDIVFSDSPKENQNFVITFFTRVILGPVLETLFFQTLPFLLYESNPWLQRNKWIFIFISSLIFGLGHYYSIYYMVHAFIAGFIFIYAYIIRSANNTSFMTVVFLHCSLNLFKFITLLF